MRDIRRTFGAVTICVVAAIPAAAQERPVSETADRPGYADSPLTVGRHVVQIEAGWTLRRDRTTAMDARDFTVPQLELRAGVTSRIELTVWWDGLVRHTEARRPATTGGADPRVGGKVTLVESDRGAIGLVASTSLPLGSRAVSSGSSDPQVRVVWSGGLEAGFDVGGSFDVGLVSHEGRRIASPAVSATIGHALPGGANGFAGLYVEAPEGRTILDEWSLQAGVTRAVGSRAQVDLWGGRRMSGSPSWFVGAGWVQRVH